MIANYVGKGTTILTKKEFDELPAMIGYELPNIDMYEPVFQFKFMDMYGNWNLVTIVHVKNEDEVEKGVNFLCTRIELEDK